MSNGAGTGSIPAGRPHDRSVVETARQSLPASASDAASFGAASLEAESLDVASLGAESLEVASLAAESEAAASAASETLLSCAPLSVALAADASAEGGATTLSSPLHPATHANDAKARG